MLLIAMLLLACISPAWSGNYNIGISLTKTRDLVFGDILQISGTPGSVTISPDNIRTSSGVMVVSGSPYTSAVFDVIGGRNAFYLITLPSSATLSDGRGHSMILNNFTSTPAIRGRLDKEYPKADTGIETVYVGATLNIGPSQAGGKYSGTFSMIVTYE